MEENNCNFIVTMGLNSIVYAPTKVKKARERTLGVHGARLFNLLPKNLRNENSGDFPLFKNNLDIFLATIPDQPTTSGLVRAAVTNSLCDQVPLCDSLGFFTSAQTCQVDFSFSLTCTTLFCLTTIVETALLCNKMFKYG